MSLMRNEYPRPQFMRQQWMNLNGKWEFDFDDDNVGLDQQWYRGSNLKQEIQVPFCVESKLSGIENKDVHDLIWYKRQFQLANKNEGKRYILHFGAVDYQCHVWVNDRMVGENKGGHTPFQIDITAAVQEGDNTVALRIEDFTKDLSIPRGKQYWKPQSESIFYTKTTGIWQTVWIEEVDEVHLQRVAMTPDTDEGRITMEYFLEGLHLSQDIAIETTITFGGELVLKEMFTPTSKKTKKSYYLSDLNGSEFHYWSPENPELYDVTFKVMKKQDVVDEVLSYFGMRKISFREGRFCLNNRSYRMKLVLDQGYFPDGLLTAPSDEDFIRDIKLTKEMGFNGARKHQKVEDPRYLYWADKMGLLVWGEMANAYQYSEEYAESFIAEWHRTIERDYNHPCIVAWVALNESWGVPNIANDKKQLNHAAAMYYITKSLDSTRPVISNDGWEHAKSDITTIHDYSNNKKKFLDKYYSTPEKAVENASCDRLIHLPEFPYEGQPILISEFGGVSYKKSEWEGWGYGSSVSTDEEFIKRYYDIVDPILKSPVVHGFCYTQLTDIEQEINGLLTYDRQPKVDLSVIKEINTGKYKG